MLTKSINTSSIKVTQRSRKELGDIADLARNIEEVGLLQPIGVTSDHQLIFGERRLRAYEHLGWEEIPARILDLDNIVLGEFSENTFRKAYTCSEKVAIVDALRTFQNGGDRRSDQVRDSDEESITVDTAAKRVGFGGKDGYFQARNVVENGVPELAEALDSGRLSLSAAATLAAAEPDEQQACLGKQIDEKRTTAKLVKKHLRMIRDNKERERLLGEAVTTHDEDDSIQMFHCPFQKLQSVAGLEPESIDLVCTDIPYGGDFVPEMDALGEFAASVLKEGGLFVTYCGQFWLNKALEHFGKHLYYRWMTASVWDGDASTLHMHNSRILNKWKPILIFSKGQFPAIGQWCDVTKVNSKEKEWHPWQQPLAEVETLVSFFSKPGNTVCDPCAGSFTSAEACWNLDRRFVGCDVDKTAVIKGQKRLKIARDNTADILPIISAASVIKDEAMLTGSALDAS